VKSTLKAQDAFYSTLKTDEDGDNYYPGYDFDLTEEIGIKSFDIPIGLMFRLGSPNKTAFTFDLGIIYSMLRTPSVAIEGNVNSMGKYPDYNITFEDEPDLGFTSNSNYSGTGEWSISSSLISAYTELGLSFPIGKKMYLNIGGRYIYGLTKFSSNGARHEFDPINFSTESFSYSISNIGANVGLFYKL